MLVRAPTMGITVRKGSAMADEHTQPGKHRKRPQP